MYIEGYCTILNHVKLIKYELLDLCNNESEMNHFHMTDNI